jgi:hypothetical protein
MAKSCTRNPSFHFPDRRFQSLVTGLFAGLLVSAPAWCQAYVPSVDQEEVRRVFYKERLV